MDLYRFGAESALVKLGFDKAALSRFDKEVQRGNASYRDLDPKLNPLLGNTRRGKEITRAQGMAGTQAAPDVLARQRNMRQAIHNNTHALADKYREQAKAGPLPNQQAIDYANTFDSESPMALESGIIHGPKDSGQQIRSVGEQNAHLKAMSQEERDAYVKQYVDDMFEGKKRDKAPLPARAPVDSTLNLSALRHEEGERREMRGATQHSHGTHAGVEPILQEDMHMIGDTEAQDIFKTVRTDDDNALVGKLKKQMGFHPDSPIPLGGKQHTALQNRLADMGHKIEPERMRRNFDDQATHYEKMLEPHKDRRLSNWEFEDMLSGPSAPKNIATVPDEAQQAIRKKILEKHNVSATNRGLVGAMPPRRPGVAGNLEEVGRRMFGIGMPKFQDANVKQYDEVLRRFLKK